MFIWNKPCEFLIAFFVRRNTTDLPPTRDLTRIFMDVAESVLALDGVGVVKHTPD